MSLLPSTLRSGAAPPLPHGRGPRAHSSVRVWLLHALVVLLSTLASSARPTQVTEHQAKAVMLLKFLGYVKWPERAFESPTSPLRIAVVGEDPFGEVLDETFKDKKFGEREIELLRFESVADLEPCHLLFAPASEATRLERILQWSKGRPVLLIGESKGFAEAGGCINFTIVDKKIAFEINKQAAKRADLELSSHILRLAKIVKDSGGGGK